MTQDKYTALWVSHTSIKDFLTCPRAYFLKNIYKDPKTGHKIKLISPPLALGQSIHEVIESLSVLPTEKRFQEPLMTKLEQSWQKVMSKKGGFTDTNQEAKYKERAKKIINRISNHPGPLNRLAVKIKMDLPYFWLSETDNIILCGKIDWLEYLPKSNSVNIIDFKTGEKEANFKSLQLPIYHLLVHNCQKRKVSKTSYWYLEKSNLLTEKRLPNLNEAKEKVLKIAKKIKLSRQLDRFKCPHSGCFACRPMEAILDKKAKLVNINEYNQDVYMLDKSPHKTEENSIIL